MDSRALDEQPAITNDTMLNIEFVFCFLPPNPPKQKAEQMENSSPNPFFSICDFLIQKQISRSFGKSFPPQKIVLPKLRPQWRNDTSVRFSFKPPRAPRVRLAIVTNF